MLNPAHLHKSQFPPAHAHMRAHTHKHANTHLHNLGCISGFISSGTQTSAYIFLEVYSVCNVCVCVCLCPFHVNKAYRYSCQLAVLIQALGQMLQYPPPVAVFIHLHLSICPWSSAHHFNSSASVPLSSPLSSTRVGSPVFPSVSLSRRGGNLNQTRAMFCCVCRERRQAN